MSRIESATESATKSVNEVNGIGRRAALLRLAGACGLLLSGDVLAALAAPKDAPGLLDADALALTAVLAEYIIPATDTPGALAVGAHHTISHMLRVCAKESDQRSFVEGLARVDALARADAGNPLAKRFTALAPQRQLALLHALDKGSAPATAQDSQFFRHLKSYVVFAYYTSEAGATMELAYVPVPGGFKGNVPVTKATRSWAL